MIQIKCDVCSAPCDNINKYIYERDDYSRIDRQNIFRYVKIDQEHLCDYCYDISKNLDMSKIRREAIMQMRKIKRRKENDDIPTEDNPPNTPQF